MNDLKFPDTFIFGTAVASYQVEGGIYNNDWTIWENRNNSVCVEPCNEACKHYELIDEDINLVKVCDNWIAFFDSENSGQRNKIHKIDWGRDLQKTPNNLSSFTFTQNSFYPINIKSFVKQNTVQILIFDFTTGKPVLAKFDITNNTQSFQEVNIDNPASSTPGIDIIKHKSTYFGIGASFSKKLPK